MNNDKTITVNDHYQQNYTYTLTEAIGQNFDPTFKPELTPCEMLALGVFGGVYFRDQPLEFPKTWFSHAKLSKLKGQDKNLNFFRVKASLPLADWQAKGWIYDEDPRGWFQWYCRYYMGRRCIDDARQIKRWQNMIRHVKAIQNNCEVFNLECRRKQRQAVLHWAYDSRKF